MKEKPSEPRPLEHDSAARERAANRVAAYLRAIGLRDDVACQSASARFVDEAAAQTDSPNLAAVALTRAMDAVEEWFAALARRAGDGEELRGRLPWSVREHLAEHPEAFLAKEFPSEILARAASTVIVPPEAYLSMEPQPLGKPSAPFRRIFWLRLAGFVRIRMKRAYDSIVGD